MKILSHRGWWANPAEKNSAPAFTRSFNAGFGTETDLRDALGELVVSHDPPSLPLLSAKTLFEVYRAAGADVPLALNVKADGLQKLIREKLDEFGIANYFLFDMSLPDALASLRHGLRVYTRQSEYEREPLFYEKAAGVWMDCFHDDWTTPADIRRHLDAGKEVCLVSPDLHKRDPYPFWATLTASDVRRSDKLSICTDFPDQAKALLHG